MKISTVDLQTKATMAGDCQAYVPDHIYLCFQKKETWLFFMKNVGIFVQLGQNVFRHHADYRKFWDVLKTGVQ